MSIKQKIISIVGARPQFVKAAGLSKTLRRSFREILVHTGQHYDYEMSQGFFDGLDIPKPDYNLGVGSGSHAKQTAKIIVGLERIIVKEKPDAVLVYGDTNSTLAGAIVSSKMNIPLIHVEAGLRSYDKSMPEEINRIVTDHIASINFCPNQISADNLANEGIGSHNIVRERNRSRTNKGNSSRNIYPEYARGTSNNNIHIVGNLMQEVLLGHRAEAKKMQSELFAKYRLARGRYILATVHREGNTDNKKILANIFNALASQDMPVVLPLHPRTKKMLKKFGLYKKYATNEKGFPPLVSLGRNDTYLSLRGTKQSHRINADCFVASTRLAPALTRRSSRGRSTRRESRRAPRSDNGSNIVLIEPVNYLESIALQDGARVVITDSGGVQGEAYWLGVPCVTLRTTTEWPETVAAGANTLVDPASKNITKAINGIKPIKKRQMTVPKTASRITEVLIKSTSHFDEQK